MLKKIGKRILILLIPSFVIFIAFRFFGEEATQVTGKIQSNACEVALGENFKRQFKTSEDAEEAGRMYCECVSSQVAGKQINVVSELSLKDLANPQQALEKVREIADKEGVMQIAQDCMQELQDEFEMINPLLEEENYAEENYQDDYSEQEEELEE